MKIGNTSKSLYSSGFILLMLALLIYIVGVIYNAVNKPEEVQPSEEQETSPEAIELIEGNYDLTYCDRNGNAIPYSIGSLFDAIPNSASEQFFELDGKRLWFDNIPCVLLYPMTRDADMAKWDGRLSGELCTMSLSNELGTTYSYAYRSDTGYITVVDLCQSSDTAIPIVFEGLAVDNKVTHDELAEWLQKVATSVEYIKAENGLVFKFEYQGYPVLVQPGEECGIQHLVIIDPETAEQVSSPSNLYTWQKADVNNLFLED